MNIKDNSTANRTGLKKWFAADRVGMSILVIAAVALTVFGFHPALMGVEDEDTTTEIVADDSARLAARSRVPAEGVGGFTGPQTETAASESGQGGQSAMITRSVGQNQGQRNINMRTLYFGENDWNFIGVITLRFLLNLFFAYILICLIFSKGHRIREYSFSYFVSNILIFMVTSLLASVRVRQGFAFGLFAILSILRFRTEQLQVREMTFLFAALILGVINSLATDGLSIFAVLWANVILCSCVYLCDKHFMGATDMINLIYDNTALLAKDKRKELFDDIKRRFGYDVVKVVIVEMSYLTDSAKVKLVYKLTPEAKGINHANT